jgi:hypothetical protein
MQDTRHAALAAGRRGGLAAAGLVLALGVSAADAQVPPWHTEPAYDCGGECYTPPTAWVWEPDGNFVFGVQCDGTMVLGGPAMAQPTPPFASLEMVVDGRSYGHFDVRNGLNDVYVSPTAAGGVQDWTRSVRPALAAGSVLQLWIGPSAHIELSLGGSRAALDSVDAMCRAEAAAADGTAAPAAPGP